MPTPYIKLTESNFFSGENAFFFVVILIIIFTFIYICKNKCINNKVNTENIIRRVDVENQNILSIREEIINSSEEEELNILDLSFSSISSIQEFDPEQEDNF